jgi:hypothetical protein
LDRLGLASQKLGFYQFLWATDVPPRKTHLSQLFQSGPTLEKTQLLSMSSTGSASVSQKLSFYQLWSGASPSENSALISFLEAAHPRPPKNSAFISFLQRPTSPSEKLSFYQLFGSGHPRLSCPNLHPQGARKSVTGDSENLYPSLPFSTLFSLRLSGCVTRTRRNSAFINVLDPIPNRYNS